MNTPFLTSCLGVLVVLLFLVFGGRIYFEVKARRVRQWDALVSGVKFRWLRRYILAWGFVLFFAGILCGLFIAAHTIF